MTEQKHILIVGTGSVGKRHAKNLQKMGCRISGFDPRPDRLKELSSEVKLESAFSSFEEALAAAKSFQGAVIGSPPSFHVDQSIALLKKKVPLLLEKPVCPDLKGAVRLEKAAARSPVPVLLGYTWRWWPPLQKVKSLLSSSAIGTLRHVRMVMSAHLADWHPWEKYQDFFMSSKQLGGGALLDESHWIDLMIWLFGMPRLVFGRVEKISDLQIETDDNVDLLAVYESGLRVSVHLDLYGRPHDKTIQISGDKGSVRWTADPNRIAVGRGWENKWDNEDFSCERNDMFTAVAQEFLKVIGGAAPSCAVPDGVKVLRVIEAARKSSESSKAVRLE